MFQWREVMLILHKVLPVFFFPVGLGILMLFIGAVLRKWIVVWAGILLLWVLSMPVTGDWLIRQVEGVDRRVPVASLEKAEAIVVLSGMVDHVPGVRDGEWNDAVDRFEGGLEVFRAGKAPVLIFTAGRSPWTPEEWRSEGEILAGKARRSGLPAGAIRLTAKVENTADEAAAVKELLKEIETPRVILVTSAFHMNRSAMLFDHVGIEVTRFPVDFRTEDEKLSLIDFLPGREGVGNSEIALKEITGWLYSRVVIALGGFPATR